MDLLFHRLGPPPYHLNQVLPLLNEASSLISNSETSTQSYDTAVRMVELIEALARLVQYSPAQVFPQVVVTPDPALLKQVRPHRTICMSLDEGDTLTSIAETALNLRGWLFKNFRPQAPTSQSGRGTAKLCQHCDWAFQRLKRNPYASGRPSELLGFVHCDETCCLLAIDHWPDFRVLEERSLQGCEFCRLLHGHLLSIVACQPESCDLERVTLWIDFHWDEDTMALKFATVFLPGCEHFPGRMDFTISTTHGRPNRGYSRSRMQS